MSRHPAPFLIFGELYALQGAPPCHRPCPPVLPRCLQTLARLLGAPDQPPGEHGAQWWRVGCGRGAGRGSAAAVRHRRRRWRTNAEDRRTSRPAGPPPPACFPTSWGGQRGAAQAADREWGTGSPRSVASSRGDRRLEHRATPPWLGLRAGEQEKAPFEVLPAPTMACRARSQGVGPAGLACCGPSSLARQ